MAKRNQKGILLTDPQTKMNPSDRKLRDMIRYKNKGSKERPCQEKDYMEEAKKADINAFDSDNFRKHPRDVSN